MLVFDYRGYGKSEGEPSEKGICEDGDAAAQWLAKRAGVKTSDLTLAAHSLGTGVAVDVGVKHQVKTLLLMSPFAEMPDAAAAVLVRARAAPHEKPLRVREKNPSLQRHNLIAHGDYDNVVPQWSGKRLYDATPDPNNSCRSPTRVTTTCRSRNAKRN